MTQLTEFVNQRFETAATIYQHERVMLLSYSHFHFLAQNSHSFAACEMEMEVLLRTFNSFVKSTFSHQSRL